MADEEKITLTKKEYDSRMEASSRVSLGVGALVTGFGLLIFDKKIDKTTSYAIIGVGALVIGLGVLLRKVDKIE